MIVGVPKEIKNSEYRVSVTPAGVDALTQRGHTVLVETGAGLGSGFSDEEYRQAGAQLCPAAQVFEQAEMVVKVKEYLESEYRYLRKDQLIFTYLHIAADRPLTDALLQSGATGVAYETVVDSRGALPLLAPMSEVAGRISVQIGASMLQKRNGGSGTLLGGVPGVLPGEVVVVGGGSVGFNAAKMAMGLGARVSIYDINQQRMAYIDDVTGGRISTGYSNPYNLKKALETADLVIGAVLIPGAKAPKLITERMVKGMKPGSAIVDVAIDQGGCVETVDRITTHENPFFEKYGVIHCSVANLPGAVPRTSTFALSNATLPYVLRLADQGLEALRRDAGFRQGLNTYQGQVTHKGVADGLGMEFVSPEQALGV